MDILPEWILNNLRKYNNCLVDKNLMEKYKKEEIIGELTVKGFKGITFNFINDNHIIEVSGVDRKVTTS
ncbi:MAG: hypothetical protein ACK5L6_09605 [Anaerorhabdus sp.]|uniref:hypothetical protein n=1 Tax=Anaerorhabdus sp. TaxID=1872524 RepID=UPI003A89EEE2